MSRQERVLCLFDVDGTITQPRKKITAHMEEFIQKLRKKVMVGLVGGSDLDKLLEQIGHDSKSGEPENIISKYDYFFAENGLVAYKAGELIGKESIVDFLGEMKIQMFINFSLSYMGQLKLPFKRGTFIEFRNGLINLCPVGRSCSQAEREKFAEYDREHKVREKFIEALKNEFRGDFGLAFVIGGQISIDAYPVGWDKTYCLHYLPAKCFDKIHFFGDKTEEGGNDYELYVHKRVNGVHVNDPEDTVNKVLELFDIS